LQSLSGYFLIKKYDEERKTVVEFSLLLVLVVAVGNWFGHTNEITPCGQQQLFVI
jgi:hypothetical protein